MNALVVYTMRRGSEVTGLELEDGTLDECVAYFKKKVQHSWKIRKHKPELVTVVVMDGQDILTTVRYDGNEWTEERHV